MLRLAGVLLLASCGRLAFEANGDDAPAAPDGPADGVLDGSADGPTEGLVGHDEDADGVPDEVDTCPHLAAATLDGDGDGVGDLCDPNPTTPGDAILRFATMAPGDQPFTVGGGPTAVFTQEPDALRFDGDLGSEGGLYGSLVMPLDLSNVRVAVGIDVIARLPGSATGQHQIALIVADQAPNYFVEVNDIESALARARVVLYNGNDYIEQDGRDLAMGLRTGALFMQATQRVGQGVRLDTGWPEESYDAEAMGSVYQGATRIELSINNVHFALKWLVVITSP